MLGVACLGFVWWLPQFFANTLSAVTTLHLVLYTLNALRPTIVAENGRRLSCFPAAVLVILVNSRNELLLFSKSVDSWEIIAGGIEDQETILDAALRELEEEAGKNISVEPVGVVHAHSFHYDQQVRNMISIYYAMRYLDGEILPGDDMKGAVFEWKSLSGFSESELVIPNGQKWILERAISLVSMSKGENRPLEYFVEGGI